MGKQTEEILAKIKQFMADAFLIEFNEHLTEETDLFITGSINSYGYMRILNYLESEFQVRMTDEELFSNVLTTLAGMAAFVEQKQEGFH
jgi:acyl carrier protein